MLSRIPNLLSADLVTILQSGRDEDDTVAHTPLPMGDRG